MGETGSCLVIITDGNANDIHTYSFLAGQSWLSNTLGSVSLSPTYSSVPGIYPLTL